jgi:hypothetical protein
MREIAHWADSATTFSGEEARRCRTALIREWAAVPLAKPEFPKAMQALRTKPRHFVRLTGLPRNSSRKSASVS